ncbi:MAG: hypothetical protein P4L81_05110 [Candidatus Pacebacteria bacterium]|nr:hypothetical protein [Candidatus Paceibacterota bacterium]
MDEIQESQTLCVPEMLFTETLREELEKAMSEWRMVTYAIHGFIFRFYQAVVPPDLAKFLEDTFALHLNTFVEFPDRWFAAGGLSVVVEETNHSLFSDEGKATLRRLEVVLGNISQCTGYEFLFHASENDFLAPKKANRKQIHVILGAVPPGSSGYVLRDKHPETGESFIMQNVAQTRVKGPAPGWGHIVNAKDGKPIAQIIGRNFYLFIPSEGIGMNLLSTEEGAGLFELALRLAWNTYIAGVTAPEEKVIENQDDVKRYLALIGSIEPGDLMAKKIALEDEIENLRKSYQKKLNLLRHLNTLSIDSMRRARKLLENIEPWQPVLSHPLLDQMSVVAQALHVRTKPLVYDGHHLGAYVIRFDCNPLTEHWKVTIYCAGESLHPNSIPHPHIGMSGSICFGNVGLILDEALVEQRIPDAVLLCLRWLADGYDESVARYKLSEWPRVETSPSETKETA